MGNQGKDSFLFRMLNRQRYADKPTKDTKMSRPRITKGDEVSRSMLGEIMRKMMKPRG